MAALLLLVAALTASAATDGWFIATGGTAVAIGREPAAVTSVLMELTTAHDVLQQVTSATELPPVRAFVVENEESLRELIPQYWERRGVRPHGASYVGPHTGFIAIRTDTPAARRVPLLLHEYVHLLTAANVPNAPAWLNEGLSEFWSALVLQSEQAVIGRPPAPHLELLRTRKWLSPDQMEQDQRAQLAMGRTEAEMFYAQSWAMVHYLLLGRDSNARPSFAPLERQWTPELQERVRAYVKEGRFREVVRRVNRGAPPRQDPQPISESRWLAERANMVVFGERPDAALPLARRALSQNPREPLALEVMGTYYFLQNHSEQAREWLSQALDADHESYSSAVYLALLSSSRADRERYLQAAVKAKPDRALAWQRLWALYEEAGLGDQARTVCETLPSLLRPWLWIGSSIPCPGKSQ